MGKPSTMPVTQFAVTDTYEYLNGFGGSKESEALKGALPLAANSPQKCPLGLYTEKLSGTAFTAPRDENQQPWDPFDFDRESSWIHSLHLVAGAGDPTMKQGLGMYIYAAGSTMPDKSAFYSADGDFLIVPQHGVLDIRTEFGKMLVRPNEICVIPRGIRYHVALHDNEPVRGYIMELSQGHFK